MSTSPECLRCCPQENHSARRECFSPVLAGVSAVIGSSPLLPCDFANSRARERVNPQEYREATVCWQPTTRSWVQIRKPPRREAAIPIPCAARSGGSGCGVSDGRPDLCARHIVPLRQGEGRWRWDQDVCAAAGAGWDAAVSSAEFAEALGVFGKLAKIPRQFAAAERLLGRAGVLTELVRWEMLAAGRGWSQPHAGVGRIDRSTTTTRSSWHSVSRSMRSRSCSLKPSTAAWAS